MHKLTRHAHIDPYVGDLISTQWDNIYGSNTSRFNAHQDNTSYRHEDANHSQVLIKKNKTKQGNNGRGAGGGSKTPITEQKEQKEDEKTYDSHAVTFRDVPRAHVATAYHTRLIAECGIPNWSGGNVLKTVFDVKVNTHTHTHTICCCY